MAESGACAPNAAVRSARPMRATMTKAVPAAANEEAEDLKWQPQTVPGLGTLLPDGFDAGLRASCVTPCCEPTLVGRRQV
jgi:hypothetical protein